MSETLVVIDCQSKYINRTSKDPWKQHFSKVLDNIGHQIRLAMERDDYIVFVEFDPYPGQPTLKELTSLVYGYHSWAILSKNEKDGSQEIVDFLRQKDIARSTIRLCGVYTSWCVKDTLIGLLDKLPRTKFKVVRGACGDNVSDSQFNRESVQALININSERVVGVGPHIW